MLYQSDITTPVSFALVLVRLLAAAWFGLNHLLTISGVLLAVWQSTCAGKTVRNAALAAFMLDTKAVLESDTGGFRNVLDLNEKDAHHRIKLVVSSEKGGTYRHPRLVPEMPDPEEEVDMRLNDFADKPDSSAASRENFRGHGGSISALRYGIALDNPNTSTSYTLRCTPLHSLQ
jgi:hypothetical protein